MKKKVNKKLHRIPRMYCAHNVDEKKKKKKKLKKYEISFNVVRSLL